MKRKHPDLAIVCTDVKQGAEAFGLIADPFDETKLASYETMRLIRYGHLFNEETKDTYRVKDVNRDKSVQARVLEDQEHIY